MRFHQKNYLILYWLKIFILLLRVVREMLSVKNLEVVYQDVILVLKGISINLPKNKVVALLGANGAGKTTVLRAISGLLDIQNGKITKGEIIYNEKNITNSNPSQIVKMGISQVLEGRRIFSDITVLENLKLGAHTNTKNFEKNVENVLNLFPILKDRYNNIAGYLSGGEQQMLAIGRSLMSEPNYLLLDEPSLGLAPKLVDQIAELVLEINNLGVSVLLVEQNANMALNVSDHAYIMENGTIVMDKSSAELKKDEDVQEFYLGLNSNSSERRSFRDIKHYKRKKRWLS
jgi:branched-chain amino acid transport system ATP-binding protein